MNDGGVFSFETDLFVGSAWVRIAGTSDVGSDYFKGRRRRMQATVQGQFKREMSFADVLTGQAYQRPIMHLPPTMLMRAAMAITKRLAPGLRSDFTSEQPYSMSTLAATAQAMCVNAPGQQPDIQSEIEEDTFLLGGHFGTDTPVDRLERKRLFSCVHRARECKYRRDLVYTFDFYQDRLDMATYCLDFGFKKFDLSYYVDKQPVQIMTRTSEGEWIYLLEVWHEKMVDDRR